MCMVHGTSHFISLYVYAEWERERDSHNLALVPEKGVGMEILGGIKPEVEPLFPVSNTINKHICLNDVRFACGVAKELKIELIVVWTVWWHLQSEIFIITR